MNANNRQQQQQRIARRSAAAATLKTMLLLSGAAITGILLPQSGARADQALIIGINDYPQLEGANLKGCVNDAKDMQATLTRMGFKVVTLLNEQATKQNIAAALNQLKAQVKPHEKFVLYYAGHGTQQSDGDAVLLPYDAQESSETNDFKADDLHQALRAIPAASRTALLDSCYSGGMMRSFKGVGKPKMTTRFHRRRMRDVERGKDFVKANQADTPAIDPDTSGGGGTGAGGLGSAGNNSSGGGGGSRLNPNVSGNTSPARPANSSGGDIRDKVCYFTASSRNEQAGEDDFNNARHGVFTHFLVTELQQAQPGRILWGDIQTKVSSNVSEYMEDLQHPRLTPEFASTPLFVNGGPGGGGGSTTVAVAPTTTPGGGTTAKPATPGGSSSATTPKTNPPAANGGSSANTKPGPDTSGPAKTGTLGNTSGPAPVAVKPVTTHSLWEMYNSDQADARRLLLTIEPNQTTLKVKEMVNFKTQIGQSGGYLVILNRGVSGNVNLIYPESGKIEDAKVTPGKLLLIPEDGSRYYPDRTGTERLKAILFTDQALANEFLAKFNQTAAKLNGKDSRSVHWVRMRDAKLSRPLRDPSKMRDAVKPFYTSDVICEVVSE